MPTLSILGILLLIILGIVITGYSQSKTIKKNHLAGINTKHVNQLPDDQIQIQLAELNPKKNRDDHLSAMCYEMAAPPQRIEYICPECSEKTYYTDDNENFIKSNIEACRAEFRKLSKLKTECKFKLDETSFCSHCTPNAGSQFISLTVTYPDAEKHTAAPVMLDDLLLLNAFFCDSLTYTTSGGNVIHLKNMPDRLIALLGDKIDPVRFKRIKG